MASQQIIAFLGCLLFTAITVPVLAAGNKSAKSDLPQRSNGEERNVLRGNLTCVKRRSGNDSIITKLFYIDGEQWACFNGDGVNNCRQVPMYPLARKSCLESCCIRRKKKEKSNKKPKDNSSNLQEKIKKTDKPHKSNTIGIAVGIPVGCICAIIFVVGLVVRYKQREDRHAQNQNQQEQNLLKQVVQVQPKLKKPEVKPVQTTEDEEMQGRIYAGLRASIV